MSAQQSSKHSQPCHRCGSFMVFVAAQTVEEKSIDVFRCPRCDTLEAAIAEDTETLGKTG